MQSPATAVPNATPRKAARLAAAGSLSAKTSIAAIVVATLWCTSDVDRLTMLVRSILPGTMTQVDASTQGPVTAVISVLAALLIALLSAAAVVFKRIGSRELFSREAQAGLQWLGRLALACSLAGPSGRAVLALALSRSSAIDRPQLVLSVSTTDLVSFVLAIMFVLLGRVIAEARSISEENEGFI